LKEDPFVEKNFFYFIYSLVEAALADGVNEELDSRALETCLGICGALLRVGGYAGYVGAVMRENDIKNNWFSITYNLCVIVSSIARATFCSTEKLMLTLKSDGGKDRHTARSLSTLCNPFRDQILTLIETGLR
jgi:hypothetical protein